MVVGYSGFGLLGCFVLGFFFFLHLYKAFKYRDRKRLVTALRVIHAPVN